jgi:hypothetical protein
VTLKPRDPAALRAQPARDGADFWPTPRCLSDALVRRVLPSLPPGPVWESAAGDGVLVDAMRVAGRDVLGRHFIRERLASTASTSCMSPRSAPNELW